MKKKSIIIILLFCFFIFYGYNSIENEKDSLKEKNIESGSVSEEPTVVIEKNENNSERYDIKNWIASPNYMIKNFSGGYENSGYSEESFGIYENKILTISEDAGSVVALIYEINDNGVYLVYADYADCAEDITPTILSSFEPNRNQFIYPRYVGLGDKWNDNNRNYSVTSTNKLINIHNQEYTTIEITITTDNSTRIIYLSENIGIVKTDDDGVISEIIDYSE